MINSIFAEKLKEYRDELSEKRGEKVGQIQLSKELHISKGAIGNFESGNRLPSKSMIIKLVEHSNKSIEYWLDGIDGYNAPENSIDLYLDKMIQNGLITKDLIQNNNELDDKAWIIIKTRVLLEIHRKLG